MICAFQISWALFYLLFPASSILTFDRIHRWITVTDAPARAFRAPSLVALTYDSFWENAAKDLDAKLIKTRQRLHDFMTIEVARIPGESWIEEIDPDLLKGSGTHGKLPEVMAERVPEAIFPRPISGPASRHSWIFSYASAAKISTDFAVFEKHALRWSKIGIESKTTELSRFRMAWNRLDAALTDHFEEVRNLELWIPQMRRYWVRTHTSPRLNALLQIVSGRGGLSPEDLDFIFRPQRLDPWKFLPTRLKPGARIELPIATDVTDRKFLKEVEQALDQFWNRSRWARERKISFRIRWSSLKKSRNPLLEKEKAVMTTGGKFTAVQENVLILGPEKTTPRTLAHELGHLLGFADCYFRVLAGYGVFGVEMQIWSNPLYPDSLMCDSIAGVPRGEAW